MWQDFIKTLLGDSPGTSLAGYVIAVLTAVLTLLASGVDFKDPKFWSGMGVAVSAAVLGRLTQQEKNIEQEKVDLKREAEVDLKKEVNPDATNKKG